MFLFRTYEYLKYLIRSGNGKGHGIHSPFVYDIVSRIFWNKVDAGIVNTVEKVRRRLATDSRILNVVDLGAGSVKSWNNNKKRKVSDIAGYSSITPKYGKLLSNLAVEFGKQSIIELGTSFGISTMYMALSCPEVRVHTIEGCPESAEVASKSFSSSGIGNIELYCGSFDEKLPQVLDSTITSRLVFIDGNHRMEPLIRYFEMISEKSNRDTVVIIDDISLSPEMRSAWNLIKNHSRVSVTIDLYRMGIVFFREGINRNHYIIWY